MKYIKHFFILLTVVLLTTQVKRLYDKANEFGAPPYVENDEIVEDFYFPLDIYKNWTRPDGPIKIGLQVGHWKKNEMPPEQENIKTSGGGTTGQGVPEWEIVLGIAKETGRILEENGYKVDIIPATVPEDYWADVFVAIHADGNLNPSVNGYKVAPYRRDITGDADELSNFIADSYEEVTGFREDPNITRNMTGYYAFNSRKYDHAIHPMTPGVLIETGFATNYQNVQILIHKPQIPAQGIAEGIIRFIEYKNITP